MGLLDDAIREHLELKRRSGADPGEVALQERAALDPGYPEEPAPAEEAVEEYGQPPAYEDPAAGYHEADATPEETTAAFEEPPQLDPDAPPSEGPQQADAHAFPGTGEETAEFDMEAILEADVHTGHQGDPLGHEALDTGGSGEPIEWESPVRPSDQQELPEQIPGQERLSFE